ncbi:uncharacterized protein LOC131220151 [Magnolia sinica]|uniref:uncharacterized protein LOC131220151 n=1 Tax=Magnolia sinica TaxID=86752 RepID=UPI002658DD10|nr:uncharacterized protein LOC131220151 [Magnolia sinica]
MFRDLNRKVRGGNIVLKLDLEKAYDRVEWRFLKHVLGNFDFSANWVALAEKCWSNSWFSVLLNGETIGYFKSYRGLRQGDPLSPSLFILAIEAFSRGFRLIMERGLCLPFKLKIGCPLISHLLYVDDSLLFLNGGSASIKSAKQFLSSFQAASDKLTSCRIRAIETSLEICKSCMGATYLGIPMSTCRIKKAYFKDLQNKIDARINGWKARCLSQAGRTILIHHVFGSIPVHTLAASKILLQVIAEIQTSFASFFCGISQSISNVEEHQVLVPFPGQRHSVACGTGKLFLVKSAWVLCRAEGQRRSKVNWVWHAKLPPKISTFVWKLLHNAIPIDYNIQSRGISLASMCVCCNDSQTHCPSKETLPHLFLYGKLASAVWPRFGAIFGTTLSMEGTLLGWWQAHQASGCTATLQGLLLSIIMLDIWKSRNEARFEGSLQVGCWPKPLWELAGLRGYRVRQDFFANVSFYSFFAG